MIAVWAWLWQGLVLVLMAGLVVVVACGVALWWRPVAVVALDLATLPFRWLDQFLRRHV